MFEGGTCVEPGAPTCTHLVVDDRTTRSIPFELHGHVHVVKSEASCMLLNDTFMHTYCYFGVQFQQCTKLHLRSMGICNNI